MGKAWIKKRKRDLYYRLAKRGGYRSRAVFKLLQINERFDILKSGDTVVDLGAAPGGWSQLSKEIAGDGGKVIAVDTVGMAPIEGVTFIKGDIRDSATVQRVLQELGKWADVIISDMSPKLSGNKSLDHGRSVDLARSALLFAKKALRPGGNFAVKVFQGDMYGDLFREIGESFDFCKGHAPEASVEESSEIYIVAKGFLGRQ